MTNPRLRMMSQDKAVNLIGRIAIRLRGAAYDNLTTTERQIVDLLIDREVLMLDDNDDVQLYNEENENE